MKKSHKIKSRKPQRNSIRSSRGTERSFVEFELEAEEQMESPLRLLDVNLPRSLRSFSKDDDSRGELFEIAIIR